MFFLQFWVQKNLPVGKSVYTVFTKGFLVRKKQMIFAYLNIKLLSHHHIYFSHNLISPFRKQIEVVYINLIISYLKSSIYFHFWSIKTYNGYTSHLCFKTLEIINRQSPFKIRTSDELS